MRTNPTAETPVKANRRLSLNPLKFDEAVSDILKVKPEPKPPKKPGAKKRGESS